ncbi:GTP cyclohydrolase I [Patulibacter medicamentivorans]|uniref:GTP cyclohydrolase I n=1 Tax=Patulibacter medicamentivorans TaxID=1097667 RepID=H0E9P3_9ACTN|nr:GTP cyclohydrolase MptA [Patulibacter medicamentivorans]EHN09587.1 GTP cyclohydrolase I [Patulibacter medicamentivorans]
MPSTTTHSALDVQNQRPTVHVALSRVGVAGVEKLIRVGRPGEEVPYLATLETVVDLGPHQKGAHMSRFEEVVNGAMADVVVGGEPVLRAEDLARQVAVAIRDRQGARRAEVRITARYPEDRPAPVSGIPTQEIFTLHGIAVATDAGTRTVTGVTAQGMTACPCAQEHLRDSSTTRLRAAGFDDAQIEAILEAVPVATHNQRGLGTLYLGRINEDPTRRDATVDIDARAMVRVVEQSMSSEIYELMKRSDEGSVVEKAHRNPRFVEDCVREMLRGVVEGFGGLADEAFVLARQENLETIHQHDVVAERYGTLGELRAELVGGVEPSSHTSLREWLDAAGR